jgi:hypothetical protein
MSTTCRNCGFSLADDDAFCGNCGQTVPAGQPEAEPETTAWGRSGAPESEPAAAQSRAYGTGGEAYRAQDRAQEQAYPDVTSVPSAGYAPPPPVAYPVATRAATTPKGFIASLFDFGFTSFVTPTVIKVLYIINMVLFGLGALGFVGFAFLANPVLGIFALIIAAPLWFFLSLLFYRVYLELFMVVFRIGADIHAIRERGDFG